MVPEVENVVVVGDKKVWRGSQAVQKRTTHQFSKQEGAKCLAVEQLLGVCRTNRAGALKFQWAAVAVGHKKTSYERPVVGFQRGQETDAKGAGIDSRAIHRADVRGVRGSLACGTPLTLCRRLEMAT